MPSDRKKPNDELGIDIIEKFCHLMETERSRYEVQAEEFLISDFYTKKVASFILIYSIRMYSSNIINSLDGEKVLTIQVPIPRTRAKRIQTLLELFAQSEAGVKA